ncbi:OsmC family protein [Frigidibacter sp. SD6-1]|uniref:OsmC family protein n=1 Tax=Frigidibacter sp. SD6-1 TaxID=3032581 RepID=UPI0024DF708D|nr:OsmC family protein [Frigidibacter sp. SD6-1]
MKATVTWAGNRTFVGQTESGHAIAFGTAHHHAGGEAPKPGPSPMELLLIGTAGCSAWDVIAILEKGRQNVEDCQVRVDADRAESDPKVFTRIHLQFVVRGKGLDPKKVARAVELSADKYCSASVMMAKTAEVTHGFEVVEG